MTSEMEGILIYLPAQWSVAIANSPAYDIATLVVKSRRKLSLHGFDGPIGIWGACCNPSRLIPFLLKRPSNQLRQPAEFTPAAGVVLG